MPAAFQTLSTWARAVRYALVPLLAFLYALFIPSAFLQSHTILALVGLLAVMIAGEYAVMCECGLTWESDTKWSWFLMYVFTPMVGALALLMFSSSGWRQVEWHAQPSATRFTHRYTEASLLFFFVFIAQYFTHLATGASQNRQS